MSNQALKKGLHTGALLFLTACVDGESPTEIGVPQWVSIAALPTFAVVPTDAEWAVIDSSRVTLRSAVDGSIVADTTYLVDPTVDQWAFEFTVEIADGQVLSLTLDVELIDIDLGFESVEFSGRTEEPFSVWASRTRKEVRLLNLYRGPLVNLDMKSLEIGAGAPSRLQEGGSAVLQLLTEGDAPGQIIYFRSDSPEIASVDSLGNVAALVPGTTKIIVQAGRAYAELDLEVRRVVLPGAQQLQIEVIPQIDYVDDDLFLSSFDDRAAAGAIADALKALAVEMLAGRGFESVGRFEDVAEVWKEYGQDSNLRTLDGPQLGVITLALIKAADVLGIDFLEGT